MLKKFGLLEADLRSLRALPNDETLWRINHEHKNCLDFMERRKQFMLDECITPDPKGGKVDDPLFVQSHQDSGKDVRQTGVKIG